MAQKTIRNQFSLSTSHKVWAVLEMGMPTQSGPKQEEWDLAEVKKTSFAMLKCARWDIPVFPYNSALSTPPGLGTPSPPKSIESRVGSQRLD